MERCQAGGRTVKLAAAVVTSSNTHGRPSPKYGWSSGSGVQTLPHSGVSRVESPNPSCLSHGKRSVRDAVPCYPAQRGRVLLIGHYEQIAQVDRLQSRQRDTIGYARRVADHRQTI